MHWLVLASACGLPSYYPSLPQPPGGGLDTGRVGVGLDEPLPCAARWERRPFALRVENAADAPRTVWAVDPATCAERLVGVLTPGAAWSALRTTDEVFVARDPAGGLVDTFAASGAPSDVVTLP
jgi:hypothetical protein